MRKIAALLALAACLGSASIAHASTWRTAEILPWYGPGFYGNGTACGQTMDKYLIGVASRTLPCGTLITISWNGHSRSHVPVVDRGPYPRRSLRSKMPLDATARLAIKLSGHPPHTMHNARWRVESSASTARSSVFPSTDRAAMPASALRRTGTSAITWTDSEQTRGTPTAAYRSRTTSRKRTFTTRDQKLEAGIVGPGARRRRCSTRRLSVAS